MNDFLMKSPDFVCDLVVTLLKGRVHPVVFQADVEDFFLRVKMSVEDIDAFLFRFWMGRDQSLLVEY